MSNNVIKILLLIVGIGFCADQAVAQERPMFINLAKGKNLVGQVLELETLKVETNFGPVSIPMAKVEGIRLHADKDDSAVIAFANGDIVTGKIDLSELQIKTDWGKAYIKTEYIVSLTADKNGSFYNDKSAGGWRFSKASAVQPPNSGFNSGGTVIGRGF